MKRAFLTLVSGLALIAGALAQTADDPDHMARLEEDGPGSYSLSWWGRSGRTYFLQYSEDLINWTYVPGYIETGVDAPLEIGISESDIPESGRFFLRVKYCFLTTPDPFAADFDGDKVNNTNELDQLTDPLYSADTDGDTIPDDWETRFGLDPEDPLVPAVTRTKTGHHRSPNITTVAPIPPITSMATCLPW